ncbi:DUF3370 domain-containing protein [Limnothrix sp. FACHB-1083]|uniref:DUF3370 domain-containing protein n=1 Tax=unclassified Limnothrix TaxID=2632864 RepID=UPI0016800924|nr:MULTISPECIES: DUF3370 domain-containing protein [unclassified Limnothrix]MBD2160122.1 DUF3370 domain-containing protein [Limnothrix sp. FACHB-1083]MBD2190824.1 DUF3370 domain-containing protein [Limnothrix sp. FACHB-1088]
MVLASWLLAGIVGAQGLPPGTPAPSPSPNLRPQEVRSLPGHLDAVPVLNSNSPEIVQQAGILLSTFPPAGMRSPEAHLNQVFQGRFDIFAHHIAKAAATGPDGAIDLRSLYVGIVLGNADPNRSATVRVLQGASYLSQPDAPFIALPPMVDNPIGQVYSGPGSRAVDWVLRGRRQADLPDRVTIPPGETVVLTSLPIPVRSLNPPLNGRSTLLRLDSDRPVYAATLARFAQATSDGGEQPPTEADWRSTLTTGTLSGPREPVPTAPGAPGPLRYGRVAGVAIGSRWRAIVTDGPNNPRLSIPAPGAAFSYGVSTLVAGRLGTEQVQTAPIVARYPDTAWAAHGNYGIEYDLTLPLHNPTAQPQTVAIALETPVKFDAPAPGLQFFDPLPNSVFFRGTVRIRYPDDRGLPQTRYVHLVQRRGEPGQPLATVQLPPQGDRLVQVSLIYPPDATPPQVLTLQTLTNP